MGFHQLVLVIQQKGVATLFPSSLRCLLKSELVALGICVVLITFWIALTFVCLHSTIGAALFLFLNTILLAVRSYFSIKKGEEWLDFQILRIAVVCHILFWLFAPIYLSIFVFPIEEGWVWFFVTLSCFLLGILGFFVWIPVYIFAWIFLLFSFIIRIDHLLKVPIFLEVLVIIFDLLNIISLFVPLQSLFNTLQISLGNIISRWSTPAEDSFEGDDEDADHVGDHI